MIWRLGLAAFAAVLVMGCQATAPAEQQWSKKDATPEDIKRDLYWCTTRVEQRRALQTPADERRIREVVDDQCMERRGYRKKG
ncbi:MAG TPA: hypothetical protein VIF14_04965 [Alphaproteobacteria bacterium]